MLDLLNRKKNENNLNTAQKGMVRSDAVLKHFDNVMVKTGTVWLVHMPGLC
jgi:hypothetical protein